MKKSALLIACAALLVGGIGLASPKSANAGINISFGRTYGYGGFYNRGFDHNHSRYNYGFNRYSPNFHFGNYGHRNFGHYDYRPPIVVPHRNHFHVIPGRYDCYYGHRR